MKKWSSLNIIIKVICANKIISFQQSVFSAIIVRSKASSQKKHKLTAQKNKNISLIVLRQFR